jgi:ribosomal protein L11 methyltransferase
MQWIEARVSIDTDTCGQFADQVAMIFYALDLKGVVIEDPELAPDEDWGEDGLGPYVSCCVSGYFPKTDSVNEKLALLENQIRDMEHRYGFKARVDYRRLDEENWADAWKAFFGPEKITDHITVKPTWRAYDSQPGETVVEIDPGMAFGTGTHPTTAMCIRLMEAYLRKGQHVLDIGVGSGILMVVAAKLGAVELYGVDTDADAIEIAANNLAINQVARQRFMLRTANLLEGVLKCYDVIVANLQKKEIMILLKDVPQKLAPKGIFICSGLIEKDYASVVAKMERNGWLVLKSLKENGWVAIAASRKEA